MAWYPSVTPCADQLIHLEQCSRISSLRLLCKESFISAGKAPRKAQKARLAGLAGSSCSRACTTDGDEALRGIQLSRQEACLTAENASRRSTSECSCGLSQRRFRRQTDHHLRRAFMDAVQADATMALLPSWDERPESSASGIIRFREQACQRQMDPAAAMP